LVTPDSILEQRLFSRQPVIDRLIFFLVELRQPGIVQLIQGRTDQRVKGQVMNPAFPTGLERIAAFTVVGRSSEDFIGDGRIRKSIFVRVERVSFIVEKTCDLVFPSGFFRRLWATWSIRAFSGTPFDGFHQFLHGPPGIAFF
jgi:hypothetical protein